MTVPVVAHDPTDPTTVPASVRKAAFNPAMIALRDALQAARYPLDAIAELELLDEQLRRTAAEWDAPAGMVH